MCGGGPISTIDYNIPLYGEVIKIQKPQMIIHLEVNSHSRGIFQECCLDFMGDVIGDVAPRIRADLLLPFDADRWFT